jgi:hypothetical protein
MIMDAGRIIEDYENALSTFGRVVEDLRPAGRIGLHRRSAAGLAAHHPCAHRGDVYAPADFLVREPGELPSTEPLITPV